MDDPLKGLFQMDIPTLNFLGEIALGDADEGSFSTQELAKRFVDHLASILNVSDAAERIRMVDFLGLNLRTSRPEE